MGVWGVEVGVLNALSGVPRERGDVGEDGERGEREGGLEEKGRESMDGMVEEVRCAVEEAAREAGARKVKAKDRAVAKGKSGGKGKGKGGTRKRRSVDEGEGWEGEEEEE